MGQRLTTHPHSKYRAKLLSKELCCFGMKLYLEILRLFSGQFKIVLYNTDIRRRRRKKKRKKRERQ